jgi:hypothetical protein
MLKEDRDLPQDDQQKLKAEFETRLNLYKKATPFAEPEPKGEEEAEPLPQDTILQDEDMPESKPRNKTAPKSSRGTVV